MNVCCSMGFPGCPADGGDQKLDVAVVEPGERVAEVGGDAVGEAGGDPEHPLLSSGEGRPVSRALMAAGQSMSAIGLPLPGLGQTVMNRSAKSSRSSQGWAMRKLGCGRQAKAPVGVVEQCGGDAIGRVTGGPLRRGGRRGRRCRRRSVCRGRWRRPVGPSGRAWRCCPALKIPLWAAFTAPMWWCVKAPQRWWLRGFGGGAGGCG